jgi:hypothetical protein
MSDHKAEILNRAADLSANPLTYASSGVTFFSWFTLNEVAATIGICGVLFGMWLGWRRDVRDRKALAAKDKEG